MLLDTFRPARTRRLELLQDLCWRERTTLRVAVVAAHPDDETIGIGGWLHLIENLTLVYTTNGATRDGRYAKQKGFDDNPSYIRVRQQEVQRALAAAGAAASIVCCGMSDQEASYNMASLASKLAKVFQAEGIDVVVTQPYEGGHPDHDATACAVHLARRILFRKGVAVPEVVEMTSYHADTDGSFTTSVFLPGGPAAAVAELPPQDQERKRAMFECFATQARALKAFQTKTDRELFRPAPEYDFTRPPHAGLLHYERRDWGMDGMRWRALARSARQSVPFTSSQRPSMSGSEGPTRARHSSPEFLLAPESQAVPAN
ncbi:MAG: PIG-L family deacetylase [Acetobacteraceae bacterium]|nr:PIG-L family deacetylase [Acetobacteraceae bacterium]